MKLAFALYRYFPYGGLQRDMLAMAREARSRGHQVTILCGRWQGDKPEGIEVVTLSGRPWFDVAGVRSFTCGLRDYLQQREFDLVVGFNKMPGLDVYFAADSCFASKAHRARHPFYRLAPRTMVYLAYERAVYSERSTTRILELCDRERRDFQHYYGASAERFHPLPPGLEPRHVLSDNPAAARRRVRQELGIGLEEKVLLCLGSGFRTKGLDRSLRTLALLKQADPGVRLLVVGQDRPGRYWRLARTLGVLGSVHFLGGRDDVADILQAADLLLHPAYRETAGNALLEAMLAGKPVVVSDSCGYADYVTRHGMGRVISGACSADELATAVAQLLEVDPLYWRVRGKRFAESQEIYARPGRALDLLEQWCAGEDNVEKLPSWAPSPRRAVANSGVYASVTTD